MKILTILNDPPDATDRGHNGLRLAHALAQRGDVTLFLMGEAVTGAVRRAEGGERAATTQRLLADLVGRGSVLLCGVCMDSRGLAVDDMVDGARRGSMDALADATAAADRVVVF